MLFRLDRENGVPLHTQIHQELSRRIKEGDFEAGAAFPSERELSDSYSVSRMTVRQAMNSLRQEGLLYYERGVGTFVSKRKLDVHTRNLGGFSDEMRRRGMTPSSKILTLKLESPTNQIAENLGITLKDEVFRLERLRLADRRPMAYETAFLPAGLYPNLDSYDLTVNSLYGLLKHTYKTEIDHAEEVLEAECADSRLAKILDVKVNAPLLVVNRVVFTEANIAVESVRTIYRADRYRATFFLTKNNL